LPGFYSSGINNSMAKCKENTTFPYYVQNRLFISGVRRPSAAARILPIVMERLDMQGSSAILALAP
jgi:hypothetical protein